MRSFMLGAHMKDLLTALYGMGGLVATMCYLPAIAKLVREPDGWRCQSLVSWSGWIAVAIVTVLYAVFVNGDRWFVFTASLSLAVELVVVSVVLVQRRRAMAGRPVPLVEAAAGG